MHTKVNLKESVNNLKELYTYLKVGQLNDHMLNVLQGKERTLDFHIHADSDEMFYVIEGEMQIEFEDSITDLSEGDFLIVPKGIKHRPIVNSLVKVLLIEKIGTLTKDNTGGAYSG
jgi:mannose-6-phosphate isomerase-like protein (cupin superfamily)